MLIIEKPPHPPSAGGFATRNFLLLQHTENREEKSYLVTDHRYVPDVRGVTVFSNLIFEQYGENARESVLRRGHALPF